MNCLRSSCDQNGSWGEDQGRIIKLDLRTYYLDTDIRLRYVEPSSTDLGNQTNKRASILNRCLLELLDSCCTSACRHSTVKGDVLDAVQIKYLE